MSNRPRRNVDVDILFNANARRKNHTVSEFSGTIVVDGENVVRNPGGEMFIYQHDGKRRVMDTHIPRENDYNHV